MREFRTSGSVGGGGCCPRRPDEGDMDMDMEGDTDMEGDMEEDMDCLVVSGTLVVGVGKDRWLRRLPRRRSSCQRL